MSGKLAGSRPQTAAGYKSGVLDVVKKYREAPAMKKGSLLAVKKEFKDENRSKQDRARQLKQVQKRMAEKSTFSTLQQRVKEEDHNKVKWTEEEYKRVRIENSCLNIESQKLRSQIDSMRNEIAKMITDDDAKKLYFEKGVPIAQKHESNYSDMYTMTQKKIHMIKHDGQKAKTNVVKKRVGRMGNFTGSPDVKVNDTFKADHRRFEKVKDRVETEPIADSKSVFGQSEDGAMTCNLLNRIKMGSQKASKASPVLKNILTGIHKPSELKSPAYFGRGNRVQSKVFFRSHDAGDKLTAKKEPEDSINMTRSRVSLLGHSRPGSKSKMMRKKSSIITIDLPRNKANQVLDRIDNMAKGYFGKGYIDWIAALTEINTQILNSEKKIKKKRKYNRMSVLVVLNTVLCFKKAFYILKFHEGILRQKGSLSSQTLETESAGFGIRDELEQVYENLADLSLKISEYSKTLINPALHQSLEPIKLMKVMHRDDSLSSMALSKGWTPKLNCRKLHNGTTESADLNGAKAIECSITQSVVSTPHSSPHLRALEPQKSRIKVYNVNVSLKTDWKVQKRSRRIARELQYEQYV